MDKKIKSITALTSVNGDSIENAHKSSYIELDVLGNEVLSVTYYNDKTVETKTVSQFNEKGWKTEEINYISEAEVGEHFVFERNEQGQLLRELIKYADGSESVKTYERDAQQNTITITTVDDEGDLEEKEFIKTDGNDNVLERILYDEDEQVKE